MYGSGQGEEILKSQYVQTIFSLVSARVPIAQEATFFFQKIVKNIFATLFFTISSPPAHVSLALVLTGATKIVFFSY